MRADNEPNPPRSRREKAREGASREPLNLPEYQITRHTPKEWRTYRRVVEDTARVAWIVAKLLKICGKKGYPPVIFEAIKRICSYMYNASAMPELARWSGDSILKNSKRWDTRRNEALVFVALLIRYDLKTMCIGSPLPGGGFANISMAWIATVIEDMTGIKMHPRTISRTVRTLKAAGVFTSSQARASCTDGVWAYAVSVKQITLKFFAMCGLNDALLRDMDYQRERREAVTFKLIAKRNREAARLHPTYA